jgi:hypothetical protein
MDRHPPVVDHVVTFEREAAPSAAVGPAGTGAGNNP